MRALFLTAFLSVSFAFASASAPAPLTLALLSDINGPYGSVAYPPESLALLAKAREADALLLAGDLIASQSSRLSDAQVRAMWAGFEEERQRFIQSGLPVIPAMGNHDASQARDRNEAQRFWQGRAPVSEASVSGASVSGGRASVTMHDRQRFPFQYTLSLEGAGVKVFIAVLDVPFANPPAGTEAWLAGALASAPARAAQVRLVMGHLPLAGVAQGRDRSGEVIAPARAQALAAVMRQGGVLAYISGHHHAAYPARWQGVNQIALGGVPTRPLLGASASQEPSLTLLEIDPAGEARLRLVTASGADLPLSSLPPRVTGRAGVLERLPARLPLP